jgi:uncharacterized membrane protein YdjX (TVP38/TMEM64 family)
MVVNISAVVLLGVIVLVLIRKTGLTVGSAIVCILFGFYLARTAAAPAIQTGVDTVTSWISSWRP